MNNVSKKILDKIEKEHIKPTPKWQFVAMHALMFILFGLSILLGSIAVSVSLFKIFASDWAIVPRLPGGPFIVLPYLWFLLFGIMMLVASFIFEKTEQGYKHKLWVVAIASIALSIAIGSILFAIKLGEGVENGLRENFKPYREYIEMREEIWHAPEFGILPGRIIEIENDLMILMDDLSGVRWNVDISDAMLPLKDLFEGQTIVAIGEVLGVGQFKAENIRPGNILKDRLNNQPPQAKKGQTR